MTMGRLRVVAVVACGACATPAVPPPSEKAATVIPCGAGRSGSAAASGRCDIPSDATVATVDGASITAAELPESVRSHAGHLDVDLADARRKELRRLIDDTLIELEAARRKVTVRELWAVEVFGQTPAPDETALRARYDQDVKKGWIRGSFESARPRLESDVFATALVARESAFARSLEQRFPVVLMASPASEGPPEQILATVGEVQITPASARARLEAADYLVRLDLWFEQFGAASELANERVVKAEAARLGTTPEQLKKDKGKMDALEEAHPVKVLIARPPAPYLVEDRAGAPSRGGDDRAPVTLVEYGDFQCPPCGKMWKVVEEALRPYGGRVRYVYRNDPLPFHPNAQQAAEAASAAHAQGRFFEYADVLFSNQKALDVASLKLYAARVGLDTVRFSAELDAGKYAVDVRLERRAAVRVTAVYTPTFLVNGVPLNTESYSVEGIRAAVDAAMSKGGTFFPMIVPTTSPVTR